jgi:RNA polymerase sigma-70 factor (ECF subfamily)
VSGRLLDLVKSAPLGLAEGVASGADEARHDELASLAQDVVRGDRVATRTLLATLVPSLLRVVRKVLGQAHPEVEDVTYEAAHAVLVGLPRFRGEGTVRHFACRVAALTAMNVRRRDAAQKRARGRAELDPEQCATDGPCPEQHTLATSLVPVVRDLVAQLPLPLAEALTLHVVLGWTVSEIAGAASVSPETVRSRLRLAKQALRKAALNNPVLLEALEIEP